MARKVVPVGLMLILLLITGCWDRKELNDLGIVLGMGIDKIAIKGEEQVATTMQILKPKAMPTGGRPQGGEGKESPVWVVTGSGKTPLLSERNVLLRSSRRLFYGHTLLVVYGEKMAREGLIPYLDYPDRSYEIRKNVKLVVVRGGLSQEVMEAVSDLETIPMVELNKILEDQKMTSKVMPVDMKEFLEMISSRTAAPVLPLVEAVSTAAVESGTALPLKYKDKQSSSPDKIIRLGGMAVFRQDKLIGYLTPEETMGMLFVLNRVTNGVFEVPNPLVQESLPVIIRLARVNSKTKLDVNGNRITAHVDISCKFDLEEYPETYPLKTPMQYRELEEEASRAIGENVLAVVEKAQQELNADIFRFGTELHRQHSEAWERLHTQWYEIFPNIAVEVSVDCTMRQRGLTNSPPGEGQEG